MNLLRCIFAGLCLAVSLRADFAPASFADRLVVGSITAGTGPFASSGDVLVAFTTAEYSLLAASGDVDPNQKGGYSYAKTSADVGVATLANTVQLPASIYTFTFTTPVSGIFTARLASGSGTQIGYFALAPTIAPPLAAISARVALPAGGAITPGLALASQRQVVIRAVGPTLAQFGVTAALADVKLTVYNANGVAIGSNDNWSGSDVSAAFAKCGLFALPAGSKDAALLLTLPAGNYTARAESVTNTAGELILEVYLVP